MSGSRIARLLRAEVLPDPRGAVSFGLIVAVVATYIVAVPDARGSLTGPLLGLLPGALRGPRLEAGAEGLFQAFLIVAPLAATYAGVRHLVRRGDSLLPFFTVAGGGFLALVTVVALAFAAVSPAT